MAVSLVTMTADPDLTMAPGAIEKPVACLNHHSPQLRGEWTNRVFGAIVDNGMMAMNHRHDPGGPGRIVVPGLHPQQKASPS